jgi:hypothetical protein
MLKVIIEKQEYDWHCKEMCSEMGFDPAIIRTSELLNNNQHERGRQ